MPIFSIDFLPAIAEFRSLVSWLVTDRASSSPPLLAQTLCPGSSLVEVTRDRYKVNEVRRLKTPSLISPESAVWEGGLGRRLIRFLFLTVQKGGF